MERRLRVALACLMASGCVLEGGGAPPEREEGFAAEASPLTTADPLPRLIYRSTAEWDAPEPAVVSKRQPMPDGSTLPRFASGGFNAEICFVNDRPRNSFFISMLFPLDVEPSVAPLEPYGGGSYVSLADGAYPFTPYYRRLVLAWGFGPEPWPPEYQKTFYLFGNHFSVPEPFDCSVDGQRVACDGSTDAAAPTAPTGLHVVRVGQGSVELEWQAAADNIGVTGYLVYVNKYVDRTLAVGQVRGTHARIEGLSYCVDWGSHTAGCEYSVVARDRAGNRSPQSNTAFAFTLAPRLSVTFERTRDWGSTFEGTVTLGNEGAEAVRDWMIDVRYAPGLSSVSGGRLNGDRIHSLDGASPLAPGERRTLTVFGLGDGSAPIELSARGALQPMLVEGSLFVRVRED
jgi:hypothetical protein